MPNQKFFNEGISLSCKFIHLADSWPIVDTEQGGEKLSKM